MRLHHWFTHCVLKQVEYHFQFLLLGRTSSLLKIKPPCKLRSQNNVLNPQDETRIWSSIVPVSPGTKTQDMFSFFMLQFVTYQTSSYYGKMFPLAERLFFPLIQNFTATHIIQEYVLQWELRMKKYSLSGVTALSAFQ